MLQQPAPSLLAPAGKCAADISEEFALQKLFGHRRTIEGYKRPPSPAIRVYGAGKQLLSRTALSADRNDGVRSGDPLGKGDGRQYDRMFSDDVAEADPIGFADRPDQFFYLLHGFGNLHRTNDVTLMVLDGPACGDILKPIFSFDDILFDVVEISSFKALQNAMIRKIDLFHIQPHHTLGLASQHLAGHFVDGGDATVLIDGDHPVPDVVQHNAEAVFTLLLGENIDVPQLQKIGNIRENGSEPLPADPFLIFFRLQEDMGFIGSLVDLHGEDVDAVLGYRGGNIRHDTHTVVEYQFHFLAHGYDLPFVPAEFLWVGGTDCASRRQGCCRLLYRADPKTSPDVIRQTPFPYTVKQRAGQMGVVCRNRQPRDPPAG